MVGACSASDDSGASPFTAFPSVADSGLSVGAGDKVLCGVGFEAFGLWPERGIIGTTGMMGRVEDWLWAWRESPEDCGRAEEGDEGCAEVVSEGECAVIGVCEVSGSAG